MSSSMSRVISRTLTALLIGLAMREQSPAAAAAPQTGAAQAAFAELIDAIRTRHAYATLRGNDLDALAAAAQARLGDNPTPKAIVIEMQRLVASLGDGHAEVEQFQAALPAGYLPVLLVATDGKVAAVQPDRTRLLDPDRPYVLSIDRIPIDRLIDAASSYVPCGSRQLVLERSLRLLRWLNFIRKELRAPESDVVWLELTDESGDDRITLRLPLAERRPTYGPWPRTTTRMLDDGVGYLRIATMSTDDDELRQLEHALNQFASTPDFRGVVIDVRGNGGGSRAVLQRLMPYFIRPDERGQQPCVVINVAKYRLQPEDQLKDTPDGYLADRDLYPLAWDGWTEAERAAISSVLERFTPQWNPPAEGFSDWQVAVVSPQRHNPEAFFIDVPVVVLIDGGCFSATDIFVSAFEQLPQVTLVGTPTAGGSARAHRYRLRSIDASVRLGTMASFRPDRQLFDGNGIEPDVLVQPAAADFTLSGTDRQLAAAVELLMAGGAAAEASHEASADD